MSQKKEKAKIYEYVYTSNVLNKGTRKILLVSLQQITF